MAIWRDSEHPTFGGRDLAQSTTCPSSTTTSASESVLLASESLRFSRNCLRLKLPLPDLDGVGMTTTMARLGLRVCLARVCQQTTPPILFGQSSSRMPLFSNSASQQEG